MNNEYRIARTNEGVKLFRIESEGAISKCWDIDPEASQRIVNHSPDGFEFGYSGSGSAQLALAILLDCFGAGAPDPKLLALDHHQAFKEAFLAKRNSDTKEFAISNAEIVRWLTARILDGSKAGA